MKKTQRKSQRVGGVIWRYMIKFHVNLHTL